MPKLFSLEVWIERIGRCERQLSITNKLTLQKQHAASAYLIHFTMGILLAPFLPQINSYVLLKKGSFKTSVLVAGILLYSYQFSVASYFPTTSILQKLNRAGITNTVLVLTVAFISTTMGSIIIAYVLHRLV